MADGGWRMADGQYSDFVPLSLAIDH